VILDLSFDFPNWPKELRAKLPEIQNAVLATIQTNRGLLFDSEGAANGHGRWKDIKYREGRILQLTGNLRRSLAPRNAKGTVPPGGTVKWNRDVITIGTNVPYAAVHETGSKKKRIPARPFMGKRWNDEDQAEVDAVILAKVAKVLGVKVRK
jgi:phage gpG-like protein